MTKSLNIKLCYAPKNEADVSILQLKISQGTTLAEAISISKISEKFPEINAIFSKNDTKNKVGVYSLIKPLDYILQDNDRLEIYSPCLGNKRNLQNKTKPNKPE